MRKDTPLGPVWIVPNTLPERAAKHAARLDLGWPNLDGFVAMHTGPKIGGMWIVRAPRAALIANNCLITSAAELPVKEGTCWPPISEVGDRIIQNLSSTDE